MSHTFVNYPSEMNRVAKLVISLRELKAKTVKQFLRQSVLLTILTSTVLGAEPLTIKPRQAATLAPEDIGIGKFVFEATPPEGRVMVLRSTKTEKGVEPDIIQETITYTDGKPEQEVVLVLDPAGFPFNADPSKPTAVRIKAHSGVTSFNAMRWVGTISAPTLILNFAGNAGQSANVTFECFVEDYASCKARIAGLPPIGGELKGWKFNAAYSSEKRKK